VTHDVPELAQPHPANRLGVTVRVNAASTPLYIHVVLCPLSPLGSETTLNWSQVETRSALSRLFEHRKMKGACARKVDEIEKLFKQKQPDSPELAISKHLYGIAQLSSKRTGCVTMPIMKLLLIETGPTHFR
jgi:hypothetical protein